MSTTYDLSVLFTKKDGKETNINWNDPDIIPQLKTANITCNSYKTDNGEYTILKYDKTKLTKDQDNVLKLGLFRSVIIKEGTIKCFSPPKSIGREYFMEKYPLVKNGVPNNCYAEEFIEGTMINLFYDENVNDWEICTKSNVGARNVFFKEGNVSYDKTFRYMFLQAAENIGLNFDKLSQEYSYSFVLQHPKNRLVTSFIEEKIYLIGCYQIDSANGIITDISREDKMKVIEGLGIDLPKVYAIESYETLYDQWAGEDVHYTTMGIVMKNDNTGDRAKIRNPNYEKVRRLRGNQPKLQYQYLLLRKERKVSKYLKYFKEATHEFSKYKKEVHDYTTLLYKNYVSCYIKKESPLLNFTMQYRNHMFSLHQIYLNDLISHNEKITFYRVIEYVNSLHPAQLMHAINFEKRDNAVACSEST